MPQRDAKEVIRSAGYSQTDSNYGTRDKGKAQRTVEALKAAGYTGARMYQVGLGRWTVSDASYKEGWKRGMGKVFLPVVGALASAVGSIVGSPALGAAIATAAALGSKALTKSVSTWKEPGQIPKGIPSLVKDSNLPINPSGLASLVPSLAGEYSLSDLLAALGGARGLA